MMTKKLCVPLLVTLVQTLLLPPVPAGAVPEVFARPSLAISASVREAATPTEQAGTKTVSIYFGNGNLDPQLIDCGKVYPVTRTISAGSKEEEIGATLGALFNGPTEVEKAGGYVSTFSAATASMLLGFKVEGTTAYLNLGDARQVIPNASTACGARAFFAQVETTLKELLPIDRVIYAIQGDPATFYDWMQLGCDQGIDVCDRRPFRDPKLSGSLDAVASRYFGLTGYRIDNDVFWDYFNKRGGIRSFGYPVSRTFTFLGFTTQFFQRGILQIGPDGAARAMNLLDSGLMPYNQINWSTFPAADPLLAARAPTPGVVGYDARVQQFVKDNAPDQFEGMQVNFYQTFANTVKLRDAFPEDEGNPDLLPLLNLELWGLPTSLPKRDPGNGNFVYLRLQRGIMHYDATNGTTQGLLLADYLKSIITGVDLPPDLEEQARGSRFYRQYNPSKPGWVARPDQLPGTDLSHAFERQ